MKYSDNKVSDIKIAYIGGGSRNWARKLMCDLALESSLSGTVSLFDIDISAAKDNVVVGNKISKKVNASWNYEAVSTMKDALQGADIVVFSILPGTFNEMRIDVHMPEKYGIYQSVGDTVGPGGIVRALRTIPAYIGFANAVKEFCPNAWVINYTNPMAICTRVLYEIFPKIKAFGCCHEVFCAQEELSAILEVFRGVNGIERSEIETNVIGLNHFTWINKASYKGIDLMELYSKAADKYFDENFRITKENGTKREFSQWRWPKPLHFNLFERYGLIPAAGARHMAEFLPYEWQMNKTNIETLKNPGGFELTTVKSRIEYQDKQIEETRRLVLGDDDIEVKPSGEEGVKIIKALLGLGTFVTNINHPNIGQMAGLPMGTVVESNALISRDSIELIIAGTFPYDLQSLIIKHANNQEIVVQAGINKDYELGLRSFQNDPLVNLSLEESRTLYFNMLNSTKEYLYGFS